MEGFIGGLLLARRCLPKFAGLGAWRCAAVVAERKVRGRGERGRRRRGGGGRRRKSEKVVEKCEERKR